MVVQTSENWGYACFLLNICMPGTGTFASSFLDKEKTVRLDVMLIAFIQLLTCPIIVGWVWSINHGLAIFDKSKGESESHEDDALTTCQLIKKGMVKLLYEMIGTFMFTCVFLGNNLPFSLFLCLWITTSFCIRVSGAHFNPAVSLAFTLRKDTGGLSRKMTMCFMLAQIAGAAAAGLLCTWVLQPVGTNAIVPINGNGFRSMIAELLGSFCFVFFFLTQTEEKTVVSSIETMHCLVLAASYIAAR